MKAQYITYLRICRDKGRVLYVGAGRPSRMQPCACKWNAALAARPNYAVPILFSDSREAVHEFEALAIAEFRRRGVVLINRSAGGISGTKGFTYGAEHRRRLSAARKARYAENPELRQRASARFKGVPHTAEHKRAVSEAKKRFYADPAQRAASGAHAAQLGAASHQERKQANQRRPNPITRRRSAMSTTTSPLAPGTVQSAGSTFTVDGGSVTLAMTPAPGEALDGNATIQIQRQAGGQWYTCLTLVARNNPLVTFSGLGEYRPFRAAQTPAVGLDLVVP